MLGHHDPCNVCLLPRLLLFTKDGEVSAGSGDLPDFYARIP